MLIHCYRFCTVMDLDYNCQYSIHVLFLSAYHSFFPPLQLTTLSSSLPSVSFQPNHPSFPPQCLIPSCPGPRLSQLKPIARIFHFGWRLFKDPFPLCSKTCEYVTELLSSCSPHGKKPFGSKRVKSTIREAKQRKTELWLSICPQLYP